MPWIILIALFFGGGWLLKRSLPGGWRGLAGHTPGGLALAAAEVSFVVMLLVRAPEFRRPYGLALLLVGMGLVHWKLGQRFGIFNGPPPTPPPPPGARRGEVQLLTQRTPPPKARRDSNPEGARRYFYLSLAAIYFVVICLVLLVRIYTSR